MERPLNTAQNYGMGLYLGFEGQSDIFVNETGQGFALAERQKRHKKIPHRRCAVLLRLEEPSILWKSHLQCEPKGGSTEVDDTKKSTRMLDEIRGRDPGVGAVCELRLLEFGARKGPLHRRKRSWE